MNPIDIQEFDAEKLPKIAKQVTGIFREHPELIIYKRKNDDVSLPYTVGEFHYSVITIVFIIPYSSEDNEMFIDDEKYNKFWSLFKHYNTGESWGFEEFINTSKKKFNLKFNIEINSKD